MHTAYLTTGVESLNLLDGDAHFITGAGPDFSEVGRIILPLRLVGDTADAMAAHAQDIQAMLRLAETAAREQATANRVTFDYCYAITPVSYDVLSGTLTIGRVYPGARDTEATLTLTTLPWARGAAITDAVTATLTNGSAQFLRANVPGDHPALVRLTITDGSPVGAVNRIRLARRSAQSIAALGEFDPWVDMAALAGATDTADATAFGGFYATRTVTSTSFGNLARAVMPAGALNRGRRDVWARVWDNATAMAAPTSLAATVTAPTASGTTTAKTAATALSVSSTVLGTSLPSMASSDLVFAIKRTSSVAIATPANTALVASRQWTDASANINQMALFRVTAATTINVTADTALGIRLSGENTGNALADWFHGGVVFTGTNNEPSASYGSTPDPGCLGIMMAMADNVASVANIWSNGFSSLVANGGVGISAATQLYPDEGASVSTTGISSLGTDWGGFLVVIRPNVTSTATTTYVEPTPGELLAGTYGLRVQAVDPVGTLSDATATVNAVVATDRSKVVWSWVAPAGSVSYYKLTYTFGGRFYAFYTPDNAVSIVMTTTDGHAEAAALPAVSGAVAPSARLLTRVGTLGAPPSQLANLPEVIIPLAGRGTFRHVKLTSGRDLPPVGQHLNGGRPEWAIETQARSANGLSAEVRIDAIWIAPHDEPQATLEDPGLTSTTKRRWVVETDRSGRAMTGWRENITTSVEVGRVTCAGAFLLEPGDNVIALLLERTSGLSDMTSAVTLALEIIPRYEWQDGGV